MLTFQSSLNQNSLYFATSDGNILVYQFFSKHEEEKCVPVKTISCLQEESLNSSSLYRETSTECIISEISNLYEVLCITTNILCLLFDIQNEEILYIFHLDKIYADVYFFDFSKQSLRFVSEEIINNKVQIFQFELPSNIIQTLESFRDKYYSELISEDFEDDYLEDKFEEEEQEEVKVEREESKRSKWKNTDTEVIGFSIFPTSAPHSRSILLAENTKITIKSIYDKTTKQSFLQKKTNPKASMLFSY